MIRSLSFAALALSAIGLPGQTPAPVTNPVPAVAARPKFKAFEVATIRPANTDEKGRYLIMQGTHRFVGKYYTLNLLIAAAFDLNPHEISGGPGWVDSDRFDILAITPGDVRPTHEEQMSMLRNLLSDRFKLTFHREQKVFSIYRLELASSGNPRLKPSTAPPDDPPALISTVYPQRIVLPARNATMSDLTSLLQRAVLDRPVVDKTALTGRYDFDLTWAPDETQFGGEVPIAPSDAPSPPLFTAMQEQLGLRLQATRGPVDALVIDTAEKPSSN